MKMNASRYEIAIIGEIARRAHKLAARLGVDYPVLTAMMDIEACHCNAVPLRLADLKLADDANFGHDVFGIRAHLNRSTGMLEDCFVPRYELPCSTDVTSDGIAGYRRRMAQEGRA